MMWIVLFAVDLVLGAVLAWMFGSGWWKNGNQRCWDKMKEEQDE
jgi:hypothetical protein